MIRILTTSYNCEKWIGVMVHSLKIQDQKYWKCYITDDMSTDDSVAVAKEAIGDDKRFEIIRNKKKWYQPGNYWKVLQKKEIDDEDIVITVDGDDWLPDAKVLDRVISYYADGNTLVTFGQFVIYRGPGNFSPGFTSKPETPIREAVWTSSHLRTFKARVFRNIKKEDLIGPNGEFWEVDGDMACWIPMAEMAGAFRTKYINDNNYVYNDINPIGDSKINLNMQNEYNALIRQKEKYELLD